MFNILYSVNPCFVQLIKRPWYPIDIAYFGKNKRYLNKRQLKKPKEVQFNLNRLGRFIAVFE